MNADKEDLEPNVRKKLKQLLALGYVFNVFKVPPRGDYYLVLKTPKGVVHGKREFRTRKELISTVVNHLL